MEMNIFRGSIVMADLEGAIGAEQKSLRPVLVVQNNTGNYFSPTTIILPLTKVSKKEMPTHHWLPVDNQTKLIEPSLVLCEQIRTIDKSRIKDIVGSVSKEDMEIIDLRMSMSIGLIPINEFKEKLAEINSKKTVKS